MLTSLESPAKDAVAYHRELSAGWERRYAKPAFQARLRAFRECLAACNLHGQSWLDAGCGSGTMARYMAENGAHVLGVDAAAEMIECARELAGERTQKLRLRFEQVSTIAHLSIEAESLDGILCSSVLEYVPDPEKCLEEFARILRPGGMLMVSVANRESLVRKAQIATHRLGKQLRQQWWDFLDYSQNDYTVDKFRDLLTRHGFLTRAVTPFGSPIPRWLQRSRFGGSLLLFSATRK